MSTPGEDPRWVVLEFQLLYTETWYSSNSPQNLFSFFFYPLFFFLPSLFLPLSSTILTLGWNNSWRMRRGTPQQNAQNSSQQGRRNQSRDRGSYAPLGGYQGGNRDASGNAWTNRAPPPGQPAALVDEHVPVRGFNSREVSEYMNRGMCLVFRPTPPLAQLLRPGVSSVRCSHCQYYIAMWIICRIMPWGLLFAAKWGFISVDDDGHHHAQSFVYRDVAFSFPHAKRR